METNNFQYKKYNFKSQTTDGYSCSLMYESKLKDKNEEKFKNNAKFTKNSILKIPKILKNLKESNEKNKNYMKSKKNHIKTKIGKLAVDPGGNKITGVTVLITTNDELQVLKYSTNQYYHDTKINEKNYLMKSYYEEWIKPKNEHFKHLSFKVSSTEALLNYINIYASFDSSDKNSNVELNYHEIITKNMRIIDKIFYFYMNIATDRKWNFNKHIAKQ